MKALILAGGRGTRLSGVVLDRPKPMALVQGRPFLDFIIFFLRDSGWVTEVVLSIGYMSNFIQDYYSKTDLGIPVSFCVEEEPLGTGGAILNFSSKMESAEQRFLVLNGDSFVKFDLDLLVETHAQNSAFATLVLTPMLDSSRYGAVRIQGARVEEFKEKEQKKEKEKEKEINRGQKAEVSPTSGLINAGIYLIERKNLGEFPTGFCSFEKEILPTFLGHERLCAVVSQQSFLDIGIPEDFARADHFIHHQFLNSLDLSQAHR